MSQGLCPDMRLGEVFPKVLEQCADELNETREARMNKRVREIELVEQLKEIVDELEDLGYKGPTIGINHEIDKIEDFILTDIQAFESFCDMDAEEIRKAMKYIKDNKLGGQS